MEIKDITVSPRSQSRVMQLIGVFIIGLIIYYGKSVLIPIGFSFLMAILLLPVYRFFKRLHCKESLAIGISIFLAMLVVGLIFTVLYMELSSLFVNTDQLQQHIEKHMQHLELLIQDKTGYSVKDQSKLISNTIAEIKNSPGSLLSTTAASLGSLLIWFGLVPIYTYLILYYKNLLIRFAFFSIKSKYHDTVEESIYDTEDAVKGYLNGLLIEMLIVGGMAYLALLLMGVQYAILIAVLFALLNMIPYLGGIISYILGALITLATATELWHTTAVVLVLFSVHFIDSNFITPYIVGARVKLNALVTIVAVVIGGTLAGIGGMFLSIPSVAILKVVFDKVEGMKHWGMLFGDANPKLNPLQFHVMRLQRKFTGKTEEQPGNTTPAA